MWNTTSDLCFSSCSINPKVNVFCTVTSEKMDSLFFFVEQIINCTDYYNMLELWVMPQLLEEKLDVVFQQDGVLPIPTTRQQHSWMGSCLSLDWPRGAPLPFCTFTRSTPTSTFFYGAITRMKFLFHQHHKVWTIYRKEKKFCWKSWSQYANKCLLRNRILLWCASLKWTYWTSIGNKNVEFFIPMSWSLMHHCQLFHHSYHPEYWLLSQWRLHVTHLTSRIVKSGAPLVVTMTKQNSCKPLQQNTSLEWLVQFTSYYLAQLVPGPNCIQTKSTITKMELKLISCLVTFWDLLKICNTVQYIYLLLKISFLSICPHYPNSDLWEHVFCETPFSTFEQTDKILLISYNH
jgi:hypothetical protein